MEGEKGKAEGKARPGEELRVQEEGKRKARGEAERKAQDKRKSKEEAERKPREEATWQPMRKPRRTPWKGADIIEVEGRAISDAATVSSNFDHLQQLKAPSPPALSNRAKSKMPPPSNDKHYYSSSIGWMTFVPGGVRRPVRPTETKKQRKERLSKEQEKMAKELEEGRSEAKEEAKRKKEESRAKEEAERKARKAKAKKERKVREKEECKTVKEKAELKAKEKEKAQKLEKKVKAEAEDHAQIKADTANKRASKSPLRGRVLRPAIPPSNFSGYEKQPLVTTERSSVVTRIETKQKTDEGSDRKKGIDREMVKKWEADIGREACREWEAGNEWEDYLDLEEWTGRARGKGTVLNQEPHGITAKDKPTQDKSLSSPLTNGNGGPPLNSLHGPITPNETAHSLESQVHEEEKVDDVVGNNIGKPPRTPSTSRAESPVEEWPEERQLSTDVATFAGRQMTSSADASSSATEDLPKDMEGSTSCSSIITPNVAMSPLPLMTFPFLNPTSRFSPPPVQLHPPPTPPEFSIASSHLSPDIPVTPLQNSRSSPSSSNNVPNLSPSDLRRSTNHVQTSGASGAVSTPEDQVLLSPKLASTKTEDQVNDRLTKEQEEQNKASREKEERERKERETVEENKRAREEAERKADEARRREELQTAERKLIEETKRTAEQECGARKRAERKTERKAEKRRDREEAARKAEEEADHKAKVDKMREDIERIARREAGLKAKREEERKEQERKKMERKALEEGERKAQVDKMRQEMVRMAKKEAELKAKREEERKEQERKEMERVTLEEEERKAQVDKMRQEIERMAKKEAELKARKEAEYKAKVDKMRENMERMAKREAEIRARREEERQAREEEERKAREEAERKELERRAKEEEEEQRQAEQKAKRIAERQTKKEAKRKARETLWTGTAPYAEAPPQWDPTEYYDSPHEYNPYMDWGDHSQDQYSTMPQAHHTATEFSPRPLATQPRPPSPSLSNFPPLPSTSAWSSMSPSSSKTTWSSVATQKRGKMLQIRSGTEQQRNEWWAGE
ncbi:unnamed protein product [Rhizoctonia solani]|uniref:Uncharacterized protein n=1 Tax=Rhizoctonia solani TaxID=456999 RepID=A0A8H3CQV1_9AGAM|nr:unnamed protein product [Rhizoctonia solani]